MYINKYIYIYIYLYMHVCMCVCVCTYAIYQQRRRVCGNLFVDRGAACLITYLCICTYIYTYIDTHLHIFEYMG